MFLEQLFNALVLGSIYSLIALGYTLVYGILMMINFAHSEVLMAGAFVGLGVSILITPHLSGWLAMALILLASMAGAGFLGFIIERLAYRPLRRAARLAPLISAIGVSIMITNAVFLWVSKTTLPFPKLMNDRVMRLGFFEASSLQILIFCTAIILLTCLEWLVRRTMIGKAIRACADDLGAASLMGINTDRMIAITFVIGGMLAGAAGVLNGMYYGSIKYNLGFLPGVKAFAAAVLGGIGNITGAVLGGFILGFLEVMAAGYLPNGNQWKDVFAFMVLIGVLLLRPSGILGERIAEKV
ncbi:MAG: branched-chain amino acid ABC transporter permease [Elusimicrobia bacterium]|nr:branched-chain amino acid ABC transporter permease [Elusimicrobiota bacterium]